MGLGLLHDSKDTRRFHNIFGTSTPAFDVGMFMLLEDGDGFPTVDKFPILCLDCAMESVMGGIILDDVAEVSDGFIDGNNIPYA